MASQLFTNGRIYSPSEPFADSLLVEDGVIRWIGQSQAAQHSEIPSIDLEGKLLTPGFVDAHVHMTSAGMQLISLDLSECSSKDEMLQKLEQFARSRRGAPIVGHGWDESKWPDSALPTIQEIDRATFGSVVYLSRIDVHSALISSTAMALVLPARVLEGWSDSGRVAAQAHGYVRSTLLDSMGAGMSSQARDAFIDHCFAQGITSVHECGGPEIGGENDFIAVRKAALEKGLGFVGYWGEYQGFDRAKDLNADGVGGDLFLDGSFGSHTAALASPYSDHSSTGVMYLEEEEIFLHLREGNRRGVQVGFHAIGDRALSTFTRALARLEPSATKQLRHRVEHAEMVTHEDLDLWRSYGIVASVQPLFDQYWASGMYRQRLGDERAAQLNPFSLFSKTGVALCFSSDAPVTRSNPWEWIRAAINHTNPDFRSTARAAFSAATRGGRRAAHQDSAGVIEVGAKADLAVWEIGEVSVQTPDPRIAAWSTDERAGVPELPTLDNELPLPVCHATYIDGVEVYRRG